MIDDDVRLGADVRIADPNLVNLHGCEIGDGTQIAAFVEIHRDVVVGRNVNIKAFAFLPSGVTIEDDVFIGPHVCFINDYFRHAAEPDDELPDSGQAMVKPTVVRRGASIGGGSTIMSGVNIGEEAMIRPGSVVTHDVHPRAIARGNPARVAGTLRGSTSDMVRVRPGENVDEP